MLSADCRVLTAECQASARSFRIEPMSPRRFSDQPITLSLPPFTRAVSWLVGINVAIYFALAILRLAPATATIAQQLEEIGSLIPFHVAHGWIWQLATYGFLHVGLLSLIFNMLMLWMFGAQLEQSWGVRRFLVLYFTSLIGAALVTVALAYSGALGLSPLYPALGATAAIYGVLIAFSIVFAEMEIMMILPPVSLKAKYFAWILIVITLALSLNQGSSMAYIPQLGGLLFGYLYVKFLHARIPARSMASPYRGRGLSDRGFDPRKKAPLVQRWRENYYKWKRRRAARKFEVYMRKHDRQIFFDEHGNYIDPDSPKAREREQDDGKTPWVN